MIRNTDQLISTTITDVIDNNLTLGHAHFKSALYAVSVIPFVFYRGDYYYPISMEFRLIDNNLLFLIEELGIRSTNQLIELLSSSMLKEERWTNEFRILVIDTYSPPSYCQRLPSDFKVDLAHYTRNV